jgi:hypothetical protein
MRTLVFLPVFFCIFLAACVPVPMKLRTRVKPITGEELGAEPDISVIHTGVTTRAEVLQQFVAFDTGWRTGNLFVGRWLVSGFSSDVDNANRVWGGKNLVVEFDEKDVVLRYRILSDIEFLNTDIFMLLKSEKELLGFQQHSC